MRIPDISDITVRDPIQLRKLLQSMRDILVRLQDGMQAPGRATNLTVRNMPGGVRLDWTRAEDVTGYIIRVSDVNQWDATVNQSIDVGDSNSYTDNIGKAGVSRWYWIQTVRNGIRGNVEGPVKGTSLGLAVEATLPSQPPVPNQQTTYDTEFGYNIEHKYQERDGSGI